MSDVDGGSAAPATPDVPTLARRLNEPMVARLRKCAADTDPNWGGRITIYPPEARDLVALIDAASVTCEVCLLYGYTCCSFCHPAGRCWGHRGDRSRPADHSGVAGERSDSQIVCEPSGTPVPAPDPVVPSTALTTGCVVVPDETVEVAATVLAESGLLAGSIWAREDGAVRGVAEAVVARVAPLIAAQALRGAYWKLREHASSYRAISDHKQADDRRNRSATAHEFYARGIEAAARGLAEILDVEEYDLYAERADELERGGGRSVEIAPAERDDEPTKDDLDTLVAVITDQHHRAVRMGAVVLASALLDAGYRQLERGGDRG